MRTASRFTGWKSATSWHPWRWRRARRSITARAAARHMIPRRSGVILGFGGPGDRSGPLGDYYLGGTQVAFDAIETIRRQLSVEFGPHGIRFVTWRAGPCPRRSPTIST